MAGTAKVSAVITATIIDTKNADTDGGANQTAKPYAALPARADRMMAARRRFNVGEIPILLAYAQDLDWQATRLTLLADVSDIELLS